jgi:hypothetical protein
MYFDECACLDALHHHQRLQAALKGPVLGVSQMSRLYYYKNQFRIEAESGSTEA